MSTPAPRAPPPVATTAATMSDPDLGQADREVERPSPPPRSFGRYQLLGELGRGGMGVVLEAHDPALDRRVALKLLGAERGEKWARRQLREAQALARLSHPNVVAVYEVGTIDGQGFIAMERVEGGTLRDWHRSPRPWREVLAAYLQAGAGLAAAHAQGLVHRDFKPSNCLIDASGRVRVADFGLAGDAELLRRSDDGELPPDPAPPAADESKRGRSSAAFAERITRPGALVGTLAYMSPEQRLGAGWDARGDQFSFCAAMCEALWGEAVLPSSTTLPLSPAMVLARPGLPRLPRIPRALRRVLARGLAADPQQRWPAMDALLRALARCRGGRRRGWALALLGTNVALAAALWLGPASREPPCRGAAERLQGVWDDERAQAVEAAMLATGVAYAEDARLAVRGRLDRYAEAWVDTYTAACEAAHVRGELSLAALELRTACLDERRAALGHAVDLLEQADADVVERAVQVVAALPSLSHCADARALRDDPQPPPELAADVATLRAELGRARTRLQAGKYDAGLRDAEASLARALALAHAPVEAEARLVHGELLQATGRYEDAAAELRAALALALRLDHPEVAAEAGTDLVFVLGVPLSQPQGAALVGETALALAQRVDADGPREAEALLGLGQVLAKQGDDAEAETRLRRALELLRAAADADPLDMIGALDGLRGVLRRRGRHAEAERLARDAVTLVEQQLGPEHPAIVHRLANLAAVLVDQGHHAAAEQELQRALEVGERALAHDHPALAHVHGNLGAVLLYRGRLDEAQAQLERALAIWQRALSPEHDLVADVLANLGVVAKGRGRPEEAEQHYRRALALYAEIYEPHHPKVAMVELNLGKALQSLGREEEAAAQLERARAAFERYGGPDHPDVGKALDALGLLEHQRGNLVQARSHQARALELFERAYPSEPSHPRIARALWALGRTELALGRLVDARPRLEQALQMQAGADVRVVDRAQTELTLAELRWQAGERDDARALARQGSARVEHERGEAAERLRRELHDWLAAHR